MRLADRYRVLRRVGEGGGGGVWLVEDRLADGALMVLKRLHAQAQASLAQWLVNEFQVLAQLDLPTVARVYDFGLAAADAEDPGGAFFTREFVDGLPLDEALGPAPAADRVRALFRSAAETLRELHRLGVVHGDLKPANLIVPRDGERVVLIDFGLAHGALGAAARVRGGTLGFMPPERQALLLAGQSLPPDPRADVYALAVSIAHVLMGGVLPSPDAPPPPQVADDEGLRALWEIARRGADPDPARRFVTVDDLLVALSGPTDSLRPPTRAGRVVLRPEGREAELGVILDAVSRRLVRREREVPIVLLEGEEGSGRSTLLREVTWRAQLRGVQVLPLACEPGDGPVRRLREGAEVLSGGRVDPEVPDALATALRRASVIAPVLILADDLDHADTGVSALLRSIAYGCDADEALLVVASAADLVRVRELEAPQRVVLSALDEAAVAALCAQTLGAVEPAVVSAVHRRTGGLPLAVSEVLVALARDAAVTPADVEAVEVSGRARDVATRRVASLPRDLRLAALAVALLGSAATTERARALAPSASSLEACRAAGVVTLRPDGRWTLRHAALEQALLDETDAGDRARLMRAVAEELERGGAPSTLRATAWLRAGEPDRARALLDDAVAALRRDGLPLAAVRLLAGMRERATPAHRYLEAELLMEGGRIAEAEALAASIPDADRAVSRRARLLRARLLRTSGEVAAAVALLDEVAAEARGEDPDLAAEAITEAGRAALAQGAYAEVTARCDEATSLATSAVTRAQALSVGGIARVFAGDAAAGLTALEEARGVFASLSLPREEATLLTYLAVAKERGGDFSGARALHEAALDRARAAGDLRAMVTARINLGNVSQRLGDLGAALEHTQAALQLSLRAGLRGHTATARMNLAIQLLRIGSIDRVRAELDAALLIAREAGHRDMVAAATLLEGDALARRGECDAGLARIAEAEAMFAALGASEDLADALLDGADVLIERGGAGDVDRAAERLSRARSIAGADSPAEARMLAMEGSVALRRGDPRGALKSLTEAVAKAGAEGWEVHALALATRAQAHASVGAELHARRDRERAIEVLEEKAALLPPDLRSAFWSVPRRAALRAEATSGGASEVLAERGLRRGASAHGAPVRMGLSNVNAQTLIATDERLVLLLEMSRRLGEEQSLERVLDQAVRSAVELTNAERGAVLLPGESGALEVKVRTGPQRGDGPDESFSQSIADTVWIDGEPVVTLNAQGDRRFADFRSVHELGVSAVAAVPVRFRGRTLGVLYVESRRRRVAWAQSDVALMVAFAEQAAIAVEHCRLVEELEARTRELEGARREIEALLQTRERELEATRSSLVRAQEALRRRFAPAGIVANTAPMQRVLAVVERVRDTDVPVVIEGESGTGKELIARALHFSGARAKGPFTVVHCGAVPETLMESELFGHVKGAFTGADRDRRGLIASASGGTLLLDEVCEMSPRMQVELLRVLQDRRVRPVGGDRDEPVDVRFVAASNRALRDLVAEGRFREDLFYRLSVVTVVLPPLRDRIEDIPALAAHVLASFAEEHGGLRRRLSREALQRIMQHPWPGNVRQLRHALESAAVLSEGEVIEADAIPLPGVTEARPAAASAQGAPASVVRKATERQRILDALEQTNWNKVRTAKVLGMPRRTLYRRLRDYGLLD